MWYYGLLEVSCKVAEVVNVEPAEKWSRKTAVLIILLKQYIFRERPLRNPHGKRLP